MPRSKGLVPETVSETVTARTLKWDRVLHAQTARFAFDLKSLLKWQLLLTLGMFCADFLKSQQHVYTKESNHPTISVAK